MAHQVGVAQIKDLKHGYHPAQKAGFMDKYAAYVDGDEGKRKEYGEYYTDSEGEEGQRAAERYGNAIRSDW
jgi:hypothetical protein